MTNIKCDDCGHVRETTEEFPTLVTCEECGSYNLKYTSKPKLRTNVKDYYGDGGA